MRIYFKSGQREKMLKRIQEDVTDTLEVLIQEHDDTFYKYEISDDFKQVLIYETPGGIGRREFTNLNPEVISKIGSLTGLYHSVKNGISAVFGEDYIFEIIESES